MHRVVGAPIARLGYALRDTAAGLWSDEVLKVRPRAMPCDQPGRSSRWRLSGGGDGVVMTCGALNERDAVIVAVSIAR